MRNEFPTWKALFGSLVGPLTVVMLWPTGNAVCIGPFIFLTLGSWIVLYVRFVPLFRAIRSSLASVRPAQPPIPSLPVEAEPEAADQPRSLFL